MVDRLKGKIILVTGAAQGIGLGIAQICVSEGATVLLTDVNDELGSNQAQAMGDSADYLHLDVASQEHWERATQHIASIYGRLDGLVNNAGVTGFLEGAGPHDPEHFNTDSWSLVHRVNLDGVAFGCRAGIGLMKKSSAASIVNVSSRSGLVGIPGAAAYASSKAAVRNHTKSVALYCAESRYPIRCNSIHPGAILTPMWDAMLGEGEAREQAITQVVKDIPLATMGEAKDVAWAAVYLLSDESCYVTGIELNVDGGILAGSVAPPAQR